MAVTIYRSTDAGALATLPAASPVTLRADFLLAVLKACLVTGYGSKAGAGWSIVYEDTTATKRRLALSNGNGVVEFVTWGNGLGIFLWDSITTPGFGAINVDAYATVLSVGVNGWQHKKIPAFNNAAQLIAGINASGLYNTFQSTTAWTIHADDKSVHVSFHYPIGNAGVAPGQNAHNSKASQHPVFFFGALKSPDLARDDQGNLFVLYGNTSLQTSSSPTGGQTAALDHVWGLRTPTGDLPVVGNNPDFTISHWTALQSPANPYSSVRPIIPAIINYLGTDVVRPAALAEASAFYAFATVPGLAYFSQMGVNALDFWGFYTGLYSTTWTLEPLAIGGIQWIPRPIGASAADRNNFGITDDAAWWS